jgi:hypothetical protein
MEIFKVYEDLDDEPEEWYSWATLTDLEEFVFQHGGADGKQMVIDFQKHIVYLQNKE